MQFAEIGDSPVEYAGARGFVRMQLVEVFVQILDAERREEEAFTMSSKVLPERRFVVVRAYQDEPGFSDPCARNVCATRGMINRLERLDAERVQGAVDDLDSLRRAMPERADVVFHAAAEGELRVSVFL